MIGWIGFKLCRQVELIVLMQFKCQGHPIKHQGAIVCPSSTSVSGPYLLYYCADLNQHWWKSYHCLIGKYGHGHRPRSQGQIIDLIEK